MLYVAGTGSYTDLFRIIDTYSYLGWTQENVKPGDKQRQGLLIIEIRRFTSTDSQRCLTWVFGNVLENN